MKDPLEYSVEELNSLSTEELEELYHNAQMKEDEYHTAQLCKKVTINSLYGALGNAFFPLFNQEIAQAITGNGRFYIQHTADLIEKTLSEKLPSSKKYIVYGDTDSCGGSTYININDDMIKISELYDKTSGKLEILPNNSEIKTPSVSLKTLSVSKNFEIQSKKIKYLMKHKVKKHMYKIKTKNNEVIITEDHSVMIKRNGILCSVKPHEILKTDILLEIIINDKEKK